MAYFRRMDMSHGQIVTRWLARHGVARTLPFVLCAALGCEKQRAAPTIDSAVPLRPAALGSATPQATTTWDARLGPVLLVAGTTPDLATIVVGDSSRVGADTISEREAIAIRSTPAILVGRGDSVQLGILQEVRSSKG